MAFISQNANTFNGQGSKPNGGEAVVAASHKFLFVSLESLSGDLAWTLAKEGHKVKCYIKSKSDADVYEGFVERVEAWEPWKDWADVIIFDDVDFGTMADRLRRQGKKVIGGSAYTDRLEIDRRFGHAEMEKYNIKTLPTWEFNNYDEAIDFVVKNPARYVFKPSGNTPSGGKGLLFLGQEEDGRDLLELFQQNKATWQKKAPTFILQKFVSGVEIAVGAYFNGNDFVYPINVNFEHKRVFPGNIGPFTGEMGTLMYWSPPNLLFKATLERMLPALRESKYAGYIDINCIVNGKGIYPLEFTSRFGYPTISIQLEGMLMPVGQWLYSLASGQGGDLKVKKGFQIGIRLLVPSHFSTEDNSELVRLYKDLAVTFKNGFNKEGIHIEDLKIDKDDIWRIAGASGCILVITGSGSTVQEARHTAYGRIQNILVPNMFYRTDIGLNWPTDSDKLHTWGYLNQY